MTLTLASAIICVWQPRAPHRQGNRRKSKGSRELATLAKRMSDPMEPIEVRTRVEKTFDLDSKETVEVFKVGSFQPVEDAKTAMERIGNDSKVFLEILNDGLQEHFKRQMKADATVPYSVEDEEGNVTAFTGTPISEEKSKQLAANVLNMAKMLFGYSKGMAKETKRDAKEKAQAMLLSQPAVIEALKN